MIGQVIFYPMNFGPPSEAEITALGGVFIIFSAVFALFLIFIIAKYFITGTHKDSYTSFLEFSFDEHFLLSIFSGFMLALYALILLIEAGLLVGKLFGI